MFHGIVKVKIGSRIKLGLTGRLELIILVRHYRHAKALIIMPAL